MMLDYLEDSPEPCDTVSAEMFEYLIDSISMISGTEIKVRLQNGLALAEHVERAVR